MGLAVDRRGITALEYTLITVMIGAVLIGCMNTLGQSLNNSYATIGSRLLELASTGG
jgi:Flp pilus assembly pilin Flp